VALIARFSLVLVALASLLAACQFGANTPASGSNESQLAAVTPAAIDSADLTAGVTLTLSGRFTTRSVVEVCGVELTDLTLSEAGRVLGTPGAAGPSGLFARADALLSSTTLGFQECSISVKEEGVTVATLPAALVLDAGVPSRPSGLAVSYVNGDAVLVFEASNGRGATVEGYAIRIGEVSQDGAVTYGDWTDLGSSNPLAGLDMDKIWAVQLRARAEGDLTGGDSSPLFWVPGAPPAAPSDAPAVGSASVIVDGAPDASVLLGRDEQSAAAELGVFFDQEDLDANVLLNFVGRDAFGRALSIPQLKITLRSTDEGRADFQGSGFIPSTPYTIWMFLGETREPRQVSAGWVSAAGEIIGTFAVPAGTAIGEHLLMVQGDAPPAATLISQQAEASARVRALLPMVILPEPTAVSVVALEPDQGDLFLNVGDVRSLSATVIELGGASKALSWSSANAAVASVSNAGRLSARAVGTTTVTVRSVVEPNLQASFSVRVAAASFEQGIDASGFAALGIDLGEGAEELAGFLSALIASLPKDAQSALESVQTVAAQARQIWEAADGNANTEPTLNLRAYLNLGFPSIDRGSRVDLINSVVAVLSRNDQQKPLFAEMKRVAASVARIDAVVAGESVVPALTPEDFENIRVTSVTLQNVAAVAAALSTHGTELRSRTAIQGVVAEVGGAPGGDDQEAGAGDGDAGSGDGDAGSGDGDAGDDPGDGSSDGDAPDAGKDPLPAPDDATPTLLSPSTQLLTAASRFSFAPSADGRDLLSWGALPVAPIAGRVGPGSPAAPVSGSDAGFRSLSAGRTFVVGVLEDGVAYAWGDGFNAELGIGANGRQATPFPLDMVHVEEETFARIAVGDVHTLALTPTGRLFSWGQGAEDRRGATGNRNRPELVDTAELRFREVAAGQAHSLAISMAGDLYAWGRNTQGQLGLGSTTQVATPTRVQVAGNPKFVAIAAGVNLSVALSDAGEVYVAGDYGDALGVSSEVFTKVADPEGGPVVFRRIASHPHPDAAAPDAGTDGSSYVLAISEHGRLYAWGVVNRGADTGAFRRRILGADENSLVPLWIRGPEVDGAVFTQIAAGAGHALALDEGCSVYAWGSNHGPLFEGGGTNDGFTFPPQTRIEADANRDCSAADIEASDDVLIPFPTISVSGGFDAVDVSFSDAGVAITGVEYSLKTTAASTWGDWVSRSDLSVPFAIGKLTPGTSYDVRLRFVVNGAVGPASAPASAAPVVCYNRGATSGPIISISSDPVCIANLTGDLVIPAAVTSAMAGSSIRTEAPVLGYANSIGVFYNRSLTSVTMEDGGSLFPFSGVHTSARGVFEGNPALTTVSLPASQTVIPNRAFMGTGLTAFDFSTVTEVKRDAFRNTKLTSVDLSQMTVVGWNAFLENDQPLTVVLGANLQFRDVGDNNNEGSAAINSNINGTWFPSCGTGDLNSPKVLSRVYIRTDGTGGAGTYTCDPSIGWVKQSPPN